MCTFSCNVTHHRSQLYSSYGATTNCIAGITIYISSICLKLSSMLNQQLKERTMRLTLRKTTKVLTACCVLNAALIILSGGPWGVTSRTIVALFRDKSDDDLSRRVIPSIPTGRPQYNRNHNATAPPVFNYSVVVTKKHLETFQAVGIFCMLSCLTG